MLPSSGNAELTALYLYCSYSNIIIIKPLTHQGKCWQSAGPCLRSSAANHIVQLAGERTHRESPRRRWHWPSRTLTTVASQTNQNLRANTRYLLDILSPCKHIQDSFRKNQPTSIAWAASLYHTRTCNMQYFFYNPEQNMSGYIRFTNIIKPSFAESVLLFRIKYVSLMTYCLLLLTTS